MKKLVLVGFEPWPLARQATMLTATPRGSYNVQVLKINLIQLLRYTIKKEALNIEQMKGMLF